MERTNSTFRWRGKILVLRLFRLQHLPPAKYSSQILQEKIGPVVVLEYGNPEKGSRIYSNDLPTVRFDGRWVKLLPVRIRPAAFMAVTLLRLIISFALFQRPKLVVSHGLQEQWIAWVLYQIFRVPFTAHVHEVFERQELKNLNYALFQMEGNILRSAKLTIFPELQRMQIYQKCYKLPSPLLAYNCPRIRQKGEAVDLKSKLKIPQDHILLTYIGGIAETNAIEEAIRALPRVPQVHFVLIGWINDEYRKKLEMVCYEAGVQDRVRFLLWVPDRWVWFDNTDISYCIYRSNTLRLRHLATASNKLTESMAAGVPVITSSSEDFRKIIERYKVGVCAKSLSVNGIADALTALASDATLRQELGQNGLKAHQEIFNYEHQFQPILGAYNNLLLHKQTPRTVSQRNREQLFRRSKLT